MNSVDGTGTADQSAQMAALRRSARLAGLVYLLAGIGAPFGMAYVPSRLIVRGDAAATVSHIVESQSLLRFGIAAELAASVGFVFVSFVLYRLLAHVGRRLAASMVVLYALSVPISLVGLVHELAALALARGGSVLAGITRGQSEALTMVFLDLHRQGQVAAELFWGLWLLPFGILVIRSGFIPRVLGRWLVVNGLAYVTLSLTGLLLPSFHQGLFRVLLPVLLGEAAVMLWLLVVGVRKPPQGVDLAYG